MINEWIQRIAAGDLSAFERVYKKYKAPFTSYFRQQQGIKDTDVTTVMDLYQDACTTLYNNIHTGRLTSWDSSVSKFVSYLIQIGKFILFNRRRKRQIDVDTDVDLSRIEQEDDAEYNALLGVIWSSVNQMQEPCNQLLLLTCFEKKSHEEVAQIMHYANADTVGTQRFRCMKKLKAFVRKQFKDLGYDYD